MDFFVIVFFLVFYCFGIVVVMYDFVMCVIFVDVDVVVGQFVVYEIVVVFEDEVFWFYFDLCVIGFEDGGV